MVIVSKNGKSMINDPDYIGCENVELYAVKHGKLVSLGVYRSGEEARESFRNVVTAYADGSIRLYSLDKQ